MLKDYITHAQGTTLFMADLIELLKADPKAERTEVIEAWLRGKAAVEEYWVRRSSRSSAVRS